MANSNIRINEDVKMKAEPKFSKVGLTPTTAINLFYNQVIRTNSIPFELKADIPNKKTLAAIEEVEQIESGKKDAKTFNSVDELMEDLLKWNMVLDNLANSKKILNYV